MQLAKYDRARRFAEAAVRFDTTFGDAYETLAEILVTTGEYDAAVQTYERIRTMSPTPRQLYTLARLYEPRNALKALEVYEELLEQRPTTETLYQMAELYKRVKDTSGLIRTVERASRMEPTDPYIGAELVQLYVTSRRIDDAIQTMRTWAGNASAIVEAKEHVWSAGLLTMLEDTSFTRAYRHQVLSFIGTVEEPLRTSWRVQSMSGALALRLDEATLANTRFAAAIATGGNNPEVPIQIAMAYMEAEQFKSAFDVLSRVAGVHDRDARFPYYMGVACIQMKQDSASIVLFRHAIRLDPSFTDAWVQLGLGFEALQMTDSADAAYTAVLSLDPDQHLVNNNFAYSLAVRGKDMQRARSMAWRAVQQYPSNAAYLDTYAWVLYRMGQYDEAKVYIEKAITRGGNATHYEHYGDILEALGMLDAAVDAWDRALTLDPSREAVKAKVFKFR
jgi:tetratricopeptide (TPR) repeat protein